MMNPKQNRSYILQTVVSKNGSWNNDFSGNPKKYEDQFFASDRTLKHSVRNLLEQMDKEVLIKKWIKDIVPGKTSNDSAEFDVMNSKALREHIKETKGKEFAKAFWDFEDVRQFGMLYDGLGIHGVVQISQGLDLYRQGLEYMDDGIGPMTHASKNEKNKDTRGMFSRNYLSEAHFAYDITVNPDNVKFLTELEGYENCVYSEEDYETVLECLEHGPRNVKSTQKLNCHTGLLLRVEMNNKTMLGDLQGKMKIEEEKVDGKVVYDVTELFEYLHKKKERAGKDIYKEIHVSYEHSEIILKGLNDQLGNVTINQL